MPTTPFGLLLFVVFMTPGFLYASQRRRLVPRGERSVLMETAAVVVVSVGANLASSGLFGLFRWWRPSDTPDVGALVRDGSYWTEHLPYVTVWLAAVLALSCVFAMGAAQFTAPAWIRTRLFPTVIEEESSWSKALAANDGAYVHAGLELDGGDFVSGRVIFFSTHLEETGDRDLVLGPPLVIRRADGDHEALEVQRVVVAARHIRRMDVTYITEEPAPETSLPCPQERVGSTPVPSTS